MEVSVTTLMTLLAGGTLVFLMLNMLAEHIGNATKVHDLKIRVAELRRERVARIRALGGMSQAAAENATPSRRPSGHSGHH
jgi:hypothetical protein